MPRRARRSDTGPAGRFSPAGALLRQATVERFATGAGAILLCGRYEGIDQRFARPHVDLELASATSCSRAASCRRWSLIDAVARLQPGVLGDERSAPQDSFVRGPARLPALHAPGAARPTAAAVPAGAAGRATTPRSTPGGASSRWTRPRARRPDLLDAARAEGLLGAADEKFLAGACRSYNFRCSDPLRARALPVKQRADPYGDKRLSAPRTIAGAHRGPIQTLEREEIARLNRTIPAFAPGDTVIVNVNVVEGTRKRLQAFEGVVIAKRNRSLNSSFIVRKISSGEGVERTFQTYSPLIASIEVKRRGDVRRAKLYYLRDRSGKSARIKEKLA